MSYKLEVVYARTEDELKLQGMHYAPMKKDVGVVFVHGRAGSYIDNVFAQVLGERLSSNGIGFLYGHNRGRGHIVDLPKTNVRANNGFEYSRQGAVYERFPNCIYDLDAWYQQVKQLGYKRVIFVAHSLGCSKFIYWWFIRKPQGVSSVALASPGDEVGQIRNINIQPNYLQMIDEAQTYIKQGNFSAILSSLLWDWFPISAQTFLDSTTDDGSIDMLPIYRNPKTFKGLATVNIPILYIVGEYDDVAIRTLKDDMELVRSKATSCPDFQAQVVGGANHNYENREEELAKTILKWINVSVLKK